MSYSKHNFVSSNICYAYQIQEIDNQVYDLTNDYDNVNARIDTVEAKTIIATNAEVAAMLNRVLDI